MAWVNTSPLVKTYTLEEFWQLPDPPDRSKLELIAGVLYRSPPPEYTHDNIVTRLIRLLTLELVRLGDAGKLFAPRAAIWTSDNTYLEPDLFFLSRDTEAALIQNTARRRILSSKLSRQVRQSMIGTRRPTHMQHSESENCGWLMRQARASSCVSCEATVTAKGKSSQGVIS